MNKKDLFKKENLIFASKHDCIIGSLYFLAEEDCNVYRGRIRLNHEHGPLISYSEVPEKKWLLVDERVYNKQVGGTTYGDLVRNKVDTINQAKGHRIFELYSGHHPSRGILSVCGLDEIKQEHIKCLVETITKYADDKNANRITTKNKIEEANRAIIEITNCEDMPKILKQEKSKFGC